MSKVKSVFPSLTLKTARELAIREVGVAIGLKETDVQGRYGMRLGNLSVTIEPSDTEIGLLELRIFNGSSMILYFHPDTLEQDYDAGDRYSERRFRGRLEEEVLRYDDVESFKAVAERTYKRIMKKNYPYTYFDEEED